jgi:hypothetical protein
MNDSVKRKENLPSTYGYATWCRIEQKYDLILDQHYRFAQQNRQNAVRRAAERGDGDDHHEESLPSNHVRFSTANQSHQNERRVECENQVR